jgi:putative FmdB family regulatory protein
MPIFSFACRACGKEFQTLVRASDAPECPACQSADLEQQLSLIAAPNKGGQDSEPASACGPSGCGACPAFN